MDFDFHAGAIPGQERPYEQLGGWLQKMFDPRYQQLMMFLYQNQNPNKIFNDSNPMSLEQLMTINPRYRNALATHYKQSINVLEDLALPQLADEVNSAYQSHDERRHYNTYLRKTKPGT